MGRWIHCFPHCNGIYMICVHYLWIKAATGKGSSRCFLELATTAGFSDMPYFLHRIFTNLRTR